MVTQQEARSGRNTSCSLRCPSERSAVTGALSARPLGMGSERRRSSSLKSPGPDRRGARAPNPWARIDDATLAELYIEAVELVSRLAVDGNRSRWHRREHLERAAITAFRHAALQHWRTINAQKRRADRDAIELTPEFHARDHDAYTQLAEDNDCDQAIARDWLAQLRGVRARLLGASAGGGLHVSGSDQPSLAVRSRTTDALAQGA